MAGRSTKKIEREGGKMENNKGPSVKNGKAKKPLAIDLGKDKKKKN